MLPHIGTTCLFKLTTKFASLDGIYTVNALAAFDDLIQSKVDFVTNLYTPAGLSKTDYATDYSTYSGSVVAVVSPVSDSTITYYFPEAVIRLMPDPTVKKYQNVYMAILIGAFKDTNTYTWIKTQIDDIVSSVTGTTNQTRFLANPDNDIWLTDSEYEALEATRAANIKAVVPLYEQLQTALTANAALQARIKALETALIASGAVTGG